MFALLNKSLHSELLTGLSALWGAGSHVHCLFTVDQMCPQVPWEF